VGLISFPIITLLVWAIINFYIRRNDSLVGPISILLVGLAGFFLVWAQRLTVWRRKSNFWQIAFFLGMGGAFIMAYHLLANFYYAMEQSFFGLTTLFLFYNGGIVVFIAYLNIGKSFSNFADILKANIKRSVEGLNPHPSNKDLAQIIEEDSHNDKYALTIPEYKQFFTLTSESTDLGALGFISVFGNLNPKIQLLINVIAYACALGVLGIYSGLSTLTKEDKLGLVISIAVITSDVILFAMYHSEAISSVFGVSLMAVIFRICLFAFGEKYWYFACCVMYGFAGTRLCIEKVSRQFPFVETQRYSAKEPNENKKLNANFKSDVFREPVIVWLFMTIIFAILTIILAYVEPNGVYLPLLDLGGEDAPDSPFWLIGIFAALYTIFCYLILATVRIAMRRSMSYIAKTYKYCLFEGVGEFWMYIFIGYLVIVAIGLILYIFIDDVLLIYYPIYCPLIAIFMIYISIQYSHNHYSVIYKFEIESRRNRLKSSRTKTNENIVLQVQGEPNTQNAPPDADASNIEENVDIYAPPKDWHQKYNVFEAFFTCRLPGRDYKILGSMALLIIIVACFAITVQLLDTDEWDYAECWFGITTAIMIFYCMTQGGALLSHLTTGMSIDYIEIFWLVIGNLVYIGYGIGYYQGRENGDMDIHYNVATLPIYAAIYPGILFTVLGLYSRYARKEISAVCIVLWSLSLACLIILIVYVFCAFGAESGVPFLLIVISVIVSLAFFIFFDNFSNTLKIILLVALFCIPCSVMIYSFAEEHFGDFTGFSISFLMIAGGVFVFSMYNLISALYDTKSRPILFSRFVFPVYRYNPGNGYPATFNGTVYAIYVSTAAIVFWSVLLSIYVEPMYYGITCGFFAIGFGVIFTLILCSYSSQQYKDLSKYITLPVINTCWLKAKQDYIGRQNATTLDELQTFRKTYETKQRMVKLTLDEALKQSKPGDENIKDDESPNNPKDNETERALMHQREREYLALNYSQRIMWMHKTERRCMSLYYTELEFIIHFEMLCLMAAQNAIINEQQELVYFVRTYRKQLLSKKINIDVEKVTDLPSRYYCAITQKNSLAPEQQVIFNQMMQKYKDDKQAEIIRAREQERIMLEKIKQKLESVGELSTEDVVGKYVKIVEDFEKQGKKFTDAEFPPEESSLGSGVAARVLGWKRATDEQNAIIFDQNISAIDVMQGALGDCYFLSAISVMGEANVRACIMSREDQAKSGAYLIKLYRGGEYKQHVIIDDFFPTTHGNDWAFAKCNQTGGRPLEAWPMILEKAYAKLYKSYENIEGGKVHIALSELTGGVPQYINLNDSVRNNLNGFWQKILAYNANGYMLGAGSPENEMGDRAINANGIVQGHAYAILDVRQFGDDRLIKLRNPHGSRGIEWSGDWSDESPLWTPAALQALGQETATDGIFWMNVQDFVDEFKYLYVCRKFDKRWTLIQATDSCVAPLTLKADGFEKFPQYSVYVTKPTTIFVKLTQEDKVSTFQGKNSIFLISLANDGKRARTSDNTKTVSSSLPPINYVSVTAELVVDLFYSLPYTFTLVCGALKTAGKFSIKVYSTDPNMAVEKIN